MNCFLECNFSRLPQCYLWENETYQASPSLPEALSSPRRWTQGNGNHFHSSPTAPALLGATRNMGGRLVYPVFCPALCVSPLSGGMVLWKHSKRWGSAQRLFTLRTCPGFWAFRRLILRTETQIGVVRIGRASLSLSFRTSYFGCRENFRLGMKGWGQPGAQGEGLRRRTWNPPVLGKWLPMHRDQGAWGAASCQILQLDNELPETPCLEAARASELGSFFMSSRQSCLRRWWVFFSASWALKQWGLTSFGDFPIRCMNVKLLCWTPETNMISCVNGN